MLCYRWGDSRAHTLVLAAVGYDQLLWRGGGSDERGRTSILHLLTEQLSSLSPPCVHSTFTEDGPLGLQWAHEAQRSYDGADSPKDVQLWTVAGVRPGSPAAAQVRF